MYPAMGFQYDCRKQRALSASANGVTKASEGEGEGEGEGESEGDGHRRRQWYASKNKWDVLTIRQI
jgi:hypothetical protein